MDDEGPISVAIIFSVAYHIDHIPRGNLVGWLIIPGVTPCTISLGPYPLIALGYPLYRPGRVAFAFWAILAAIGLGFVGLTHLRPLALKPPEDILYAYRPRLAGTLEFLAVFVVARLCAGKGGFAAGRERTN